MQDQHRSVEETRTRGQRLQLTHSSIA
jgi:hypothetical protein